MKKSLTLIEVMIALSLTAIVVAVLLNIYRNQQYSSAKLHAVKQKVIARQCIQQRFTEIFNRLDRENEDETPACLTDNGMVILRYDNGIDHDSSFSGVAGAEFYVNKQQELCLMTKGKDHKTRTEILMTGVKSLNTEFFSPSEKIWVTNWGEEREELPAMVKFSIMEEDLLPFTFFLPDSTGPIMYTKEGKVL